MEEPNQHRSACIYIGRKVPEYAQATNSVLIFLRENQLSEPDISIAILCWCGLDGAVFQLGETMFIRPIRPNSIAVSPNLFAGEIPLEKFQQAGENFATFAGDRKTYRALIDLAGEQLAKRLLLLVRDAAALQAFSRNNRLLKQLRDQNFFSRMLVSEEQQFSFLSFQKIFDQNRASFALPPDITSLSSDISIDGNSKLTFVADYSEVLGDRQPITAIIGANGAGKTRLLLSIAEAALTPDRLLVRSSAGRGGKAVLERLEHLKQTVDVLSFTYEPALWGRARRKGAKVVNLGVGNREWKRLTALLFNLAQNDRSKFHLSAYVQIVSSIVDPSDLLLPVATSARHPGKLQFDNRHCYVSLANLVRSYDRVLISQIEPSREVITFSNHFGPYSLSSGQRSLLLFIAQLFMHGERSLVLIDEPENHLHPQFVTMLMQALQSTLIAMESRAIVVTHSPYVIRELDKTAVQILDKDADGIACIYQTSLQTFGADVGQISGYVFRDHLVQKGFERRIDRLIAFASKAFHSTEEMTRQISPSLGDDAELYLQTMIGRRRNADISDS